MDTKKNAGPWVFRSTKRSHKVFEEVFLIIHPNQDVGHLSVVIGRQNVDDFAIAWEILTNTNPCAIKQIYEKCKPNFEILCNNWFVSSQTKKIDLNAAGKEAYKKIKNFIKMMELLYYKRTEFYAKLEWIDVQEEWKKAIREKHATPTTYPYHKFVEFLREYENNNNTKFIDTNA